MKQEETNVWKQALIDFSPLGFRLFRNQRYKGQIVKNGKITNAWANCGLYDGAGDLVGYKIVTITQDMVGEKIAQYTNLETKLDDNEESTDQSNGNEQLRKDGAIAGVIRPSTGTIILLK